VAAKELHPGLGERVKTNSEISILKCPKLNLLHAHFTKEIPQRKISCYIPCKVYTYPSGFGCLACHQKRLNAFPLKSVAVPPCDKSILEYMYMYTNMRPVPEEYG
jgi:hypothetical protein